MTAAITAKVFWSGGSQAVRLPKAMRLRASEVTVRRRGDEIVLGPVEQGDNWDGFWDRLVTLKQPIRRWKVRPAERRKPM